VARMRKSARTASRERQVVWLAAGVPSWRIVESVELPNRRVRRLLRVLGAESTHGPPSPPCSPSRSALRSPEAWFSIDTPAHSEMQKPHTSMLCRKTNRR
jgi:hypothetical protein